MQFFFSILKVHRVVERQVHVIGEANQSTD